MRFNQESTFAFYNQRFASGSDGRAMTSRQANQKAADEFYQLCHNKEFWLWGQKHHETYRVCPKCNERYYEKPRVQNIEGKVHILNTWADTCDQCNIKLIWNDDLILGTADCCYNHIIGTPVKERKDFDLNKRFVDPMPIFDWQKSIFDTFEDGNDYCYIKSTGLGFSEIKLRHSTWRCTKDYEYSKAQIPIVVGPRQSLAILLMARLKGFFPFVTFDPITGKPEDKETATINGCWIHVFPANNIAGIRSLKNPVETIVDEFDFFVTIDPRVVLGALFRYIAKSGQVLRGISTPNKPDGLCASLEQDPQRFIIVKLFWTVGLFSLYTPREIAEQKKAPNFDQEYGLEYLGGVGNFFNPENVDACMTEEYNPDIPVREAITIMAQDTGYSAGPRPSYFGITIWSWFNFKLWCMYAKQFKQPMESTMIELSKSLRHKYMVDKILIDGSDPSYIRNLKESLREFPVYYDTVPKEEYRKMIVEPVPFSKMQYDFLVHDRSMIDRRAVRYHPSQKALAVAFKSCWVEGDTYVKEKSSNTDLLDSSSMVFKRFNPKTFNVCVRT